MTKYAVQKNNQYHHEFTEHVTIASSANVTVVGSLKDSIAALITGAQTAEADSFDYSFSHRCRGELSVGLDLEFNIRYEQKRTGIIRNPREKHFIQHNKSITFSGSSFFSPEKQIQRGLLVEASMTILIVDVNDLDDNGFLYKKYSDQLEAANVTIFLTRGNNFSIHRISKKSNVINTHETNITIIAKALTDEVERIVEQNVNALINQHVENRTLDFIRTKEVEMMNQIHRDADDYFATNSSCFLN